ncbi:MAG: hypothetical protein ACE14S_01460 [Candidatus Bathyarchaeia archaeon]
MFEDITPVLATILDQFTTMYLIGVTGVFIGFPLVKLGNHYGKILGDKKFKSTEVLFVGVVVSVILVGLLFKFVEPYVLELVVPFTKWSPIMFSTGTLALYGWFLHALDVEIRWKVIVPLVFIILINAGFLVFSGYFA